MYSFLPRLPYPSAIFEATETAERLIWRGLDNEKK